MKLLFDQNVFPDLVRRLHDLFPGFPPKLLWLRIGNCRTSDIEDLIRSHYDLILKLAQDERRGILSLFGRDAG